MPSIYDLKPRFQALLRPLVRALAVAGVTASQVTIAAAILSILVGVFIACYPQAHWPLLLMPVALFIRMALNAIDGMLAREHGMIVFFAFVSFLALKEYFSIVPIRRADRRVLFWAYLAIPIQYYWVAQAWYGMFIIFIPVYVFLLLPMRMVVIGQTKDFLRAAGTLHWGVMTLVFGISHIAYLMALPEARNAAGGAGLVLFLLFLTDINDVTQYLCGKTFGRHKIIPKVSPNKTWGGFLGGVATTTGLSVLLAPWLTPLSLKNAVLAGALIGVGGFVGDVTISALKRDIGLKDSGSILPGHGGILDRIDSLTYTAPLFFHFVYYLYY